MNVRNNFRIGGTVRETPVCVDHPDGGRTIKFDIVSMNNYKLRDGTPTYETLPVAVYRSAEMINDPKRGSGVAGTIQAGDQVVVQGSVRNNNWTDAMAQPHYELVLQVETLDVIQRAGSVTA